MTVGELIKELAQYPFEATVKYFNSMLYDKYGADELQPLEEVIYDNNEVHLY